MAKKPLSTPPGELAQPTAGGSYRRKPDGSLELAESTAPHASAEAEPPAAAPAAEPATGEA